MKNTSDSKTTVANGGFYVEEGCCTSCGVPQMIAPELVGWTEEAWPSCYWIRQPDSAEEVERAIRIIQEQELGCHRYSGNDAGILRRLRRRSLGRVFGSGKIGGMVKSFWHWVARSVGK